MLKLYHNARPGIKAAFAMYGMLDAAFPRNQQVPAGSGGFEDQRRGLVNQLRALPVKD
jgi:hypothetical protein